MILITVSILSGILGFHMGRNREIGEWPGFFLGVLLGLIGILIIICFKRNDKTKM